MGLTGKFELTTSKRLPGFRLYSFVLKNTNLLQSVTVDVMLSDEYNQNPFYFRGQKLAEMPEMQRTRLCLSCRADVGVSDM